VLGFAAMNTRDKRGTPVREQFAAWFVRSSMTTSEIDGCRVSRNINGVNADVVVTGTRLHAWNRSRRDALNDHQIENKAARMATAALQKAGAKNDERWVVTISGDDINGQVSAQRVH
jgi:hypothetical protein